MGGGHLVQRGQDAQAGLAQQRAHAFTARALRQVGLMAVLAGQEATRQRPPGDDAQALALHQRFERAFVAAARGEVVLRLQHFIARQAQPRAHGQCLGQPGRAVVGGADGAHRAFADQLGKGRQRFFQWGVSVVGVGLVEIDVIGLQPAQ